MRIARGQGVGRSTKAGHDDAEKIMSCEILTTPELSFGLFDWQGQGTTHKEQNTEGRISGKFNTVRRWHGKPGGTIVA